MKALSQYDPKTVIQTALAHPSNVLSIGIDIAEETHIPVRYHFRNLKLRLQ